MMRFLIDDANGSRWQPIGYFGNVTTLAGPRYERIIEPLVVGHHVIEARAHKINNLGSRGEIIRYNSTIREI